jgi:1,4-dihydroxy-2-naphthoate octaprenyltransferase
MNMRQFFAIVEMRTKIVSVSTYLLATLYVVYRTGRIDPVTASLMFLATLLVDMGTTGFNTYFDYRRGVDNALYNREESKVVVHEDVPWGWALLVSLALFGAALPLGITLAVLAGWPVIIAGAACMAVGYFYTGGPYPISRTPLGELFAGGTLGSVLFLLVYYIQAGMPDLTALLVSLPSSLVIAAILTVNNTCDRVGDRAAGRKTMSILLGRTGGEVLGIAEVAAGYLLLAAGGPAGRLPAWAPLAVLPFASLSAREFVVMHRRGYSHETKGISMGGISRIFLQFTAAAALIIIGGLITGQAGPIPGTP